jgi:hypothetical protein
VLSLIAAAVLTQTVFTWVDASGVTHFTDDPSKVPANVCATKTTGDDISVIPAPPLPTPPPQPPPPPARQPAPPPAPEYGPPPEQTLGYPLWWGPAVYWGHWGRPLRVVPTTAFAPPVKVPAPPLQPRASGGRGAMMVPHAPGPRR